MNKALVCLALLATTCAAFGRTFKVLYTFRGSASGDGARPLSRLLRDGAGNLYGTTSRGGNGSGTVFELLPNANGTWTETILYTFCPPSNCGNDGVNPASGLIVDSVGNLYGTTSSGGSVGGGTVFELSPPSSPGGAWTEKVLLSFDAPGNVGICVPSGDLVSDASGNLYGTTAQCGFGKDAFGTVFELSPSANGVWTKSVLYTFNGTNEVSPNGINPEGGVIFDAAGNLYGTTLLGGKRHGGVVFELSPNGDGTWAETVIYAFSQTKSLAAPASGLTLDATGTVRHDRVWRSSRWQL